MIFSTTLVSAIAATLVSASHHSSANLTSKSSQKSSISNSNENSNSFKEKAEKYFKSDDITGLKDSVLKDQVGSKPSGGRVIGLAYREDKRDNKKSNLHVNNILGPIFIDACKEGKLDFVKYFVEDEKLNPLKDYHNDSNCAGSSNEKGSSKSKFLKLLFSKKDDDDSNKNSGHNEETGSYGVGESKKNILGKNGSGTRKPVKSCLYQAVSENHEEVLDYLFSNLKVTSSDSTAPFKALTKLAESFPEDKQQNIIDAVKMLAEKSCKSFVQSGKHNLSSLSNESSIMPELKTKMFSAIFEKCYDYLNLDPKNKGKTMNYKQIEEMIKKYPGSNDSSVSRIGSGSDYDLDYEFGNHSRSYGNSGHSQYLLGSSSEKNPFNSNSNDKSKYKKYNLSSDRPKSTGFSKTYQNISPKSVRKQEEESEDNDE